MSHTNQRMDTLVLLNSASVGYPEGYEIILPYLDHLGVPYTCLDLVHSPLPANVGDYALVVVAHRRLDPSGTRLGKAGRRALLAAVRDSSGLVSFDPTFPNRTDLGLTGSATTATARVHKAATIEFRRQHFITTLHELDEICPLVGSLRIPAVATTDDSVLLSAGERPLLSVVPLGRGRVVQWATSLWLRTNVLGPLAGLDDVLWRSLVWAARKPFALRGLPPLVTMRVDDVAAWGGLWQQRPLYWVHHANQYQFKPWLGLFIYNLTEAAVNELRDLIKRGQVTAFPHAFGRPPRSGNNDIHYYEHALPLRATEYDEFIYFDHHNGRPWSNTEATRGLAAVDAWYAAHPSLPMSDYALPHWYEMGSNVVTHVQDRWGAKLIGKVNDLNKPMVNRVQWLKSGPFRRYEKPGTCFMDPSRRGDRPVYYADFVNFGGRQFFNCVTEIRDDAGYEWQPDNDVAGTVGRGVRQLRRALDSMALAVLFTHETDYIYKIRPEAWADAVTQVAAGIANYNPIYVTLDEGVRYVRATRTSRLGSCAYNPATGEVTAAVSGYADVPTHFHLFTEGGGEIMTTLVEIPVFDGKTIIMHRLRGE